MKNLYSMQKFMFSNPVKCGISSIYFMYRKILVYFKNNKVKLSNKKNPAYGRQSISLPMRIVAPIPQ